MRNIYKVTSIYEAFVFADSCDEAEILFNNDEEFLGSEFIESEKVDIREVIDQLEYELKK